MPAFQSKYLEASAAEVNGAGISPQLSYCQNEQQTSGQTQRPLCPGHVPVFSEFESNFAEDADRLEAKLLMQFCRRRIRQRVSGHNAMDVLARDGLKQCGIKPFANALAHRFRAAVDGRL